MCPNCRAFVTTDDKTCPYCDVQLGSRVIDRRAPSDILGIPHQYFATAVFMLVNFGLYLVTLIYTSRETSSGFPLEPGFNALLAFGAMSQNDLRHGDWWRLITAGFLHGGIIHILMNSWSLFQIGPLAEASFGTNRYLTVMVVSTFTGFFASYLSGTFLSVGASAAICGIVGAMIALGTREHHAIASAIRGSLIQSMVFVLLIGFYYPFIDNYAHIGGFIGGFVVGYLAGSPTLRPSTENIWRTASIASLTVIAYAFVRLALSLQQTLAR